MGNENQWTITDSSAGADHLTIHGSNGYSEVVHHTEAAARIHELNNPTEDTK